MRKLLMVLFLIIALFILFLPQIASTPLGKPLFVRALEAKIQSKVEVGSLSLSWFGPQKFQQIRWTHDQVTGTADEFRVHAPFWSFKGAFELKNGSISYKEGTVDHIEGQMENNDFELRGVTLQGHLLLKGKVYSKLHFFIAVDMKNFPLLVIDQRLDQILGPTLDLEGTISLENNQGTIDLDFNSANFNTKLRGNLTENSITLRNPLKAAIRLTPALSSLLLKDANPLFLNGMESQSPLILTIANEDFFFPLPFSLEKLKAKGTLDLGQIKCQNGKTVATIISLLKATRLSEAQQMNAWFTPVQYQIDQGTIKTGRMDALLADSIHICTWGKVDLLRDEVLMNLGLPADTLEQSFRIKGLPANYVLKVPIRGTTKDPEIVKGPAAAQIAALIAAGQIPKKGFFGGLADLISKPKEDQKIPAANRPFPWEK